ncbi:hypothetical protein [Leeuwenhoekiella nanhaiensis]|uniref:Glycine zipper family protein n=1 Tax=Leeuwenhoekiella nanhaiensis TaxID=1655491 RepID=A0A2G1VMF8_9FLAO|nr:hypothetical protein [Leeuwenhoekiella nanhaiensis]PHQ27914.1 hypothetical protein CJ305_17760 [Leeuwenhoekiella nanhaiensis]
MNNSKLKSHLEGFQKLIKSLESKDIKTKTNDYINSQIERINSFNESEKQLKRELIKAKMAVLKHLEKNENLVPKNHYQRLWLVLGMSAFGVPIGVLLGLVTGKMGLLGVGLPIGMFIGLIFGKRLDKKAADENRQLDFSH